MTDKIISIIDNIEKLPPEKIYISLLNFSRYFEFAFPTHTMLESKNLFSEPGHIKIMKIYY